MFKECKPEDYVFTDENGNTYISTPQGNVMFAMGLIMVISTVILPAILTFILS